MQLDFEQILFAFMHHPAKLIEQSEANYSLQIQHIANHIAQEQNAKPFLLLSGASASGKTTTAQRIARELRTKGIEVAVLSMDDYYQSYGTYDIPKDEQGKEDLESPLCIDIPKLQKDLQDLKCGKSICMPVFDFHQKRRKEEGKPIGVKPRQMILVEGIHAFHPELTGVIQEVSQCVAVCLDDTVQLEDGTQLSSDALRFARRACRDLHFRNASIECTLELWRNVKRGERRYILPYAHVATQVVHSFLPYEIFFLFARIQSALKEQKIWLEDLGLGALCHVPDFPHLSMQSIAIPADSLVHEFVPSLSN